MPKSQANETQPKQNYRQQTNNPKGAAASVSINLISPQSVNNQNSPYKQQKHDNIYKYMPAIQEFSLPEIDETKQDSINQVFNNSTMIKKYPVKISPPRTVKNPRFDAQSVLQKWQSQKWNMGPQGTKNIESYLALKSIQFRRYLYNVYVLQRSALKIQHWFFGLKALQQRQEQLRNDQSQISSSNYQSLHNKLREVNTMTIQEKERDAIKKMVAKRLSPGANLNNSQSPPTYVTQILGNSPDIYEVHQQFKRDTSRNINQRKTYSQEAFILNSTRLPLRNEMRNSEGKRDGSSQDNKSLENLQKTFEQPQVVVERTSISSQRGNKQNERFEKINRIAQNYEERTFYQAPTNITAVNQSQTTLQDKNQFLGQKNQDGANQSSLLELSLISDKNQHTRLITNKYQYRPMTSRLNESSQLLISGSEHQSNSNFVKRFKPTKDIEQALNVRKGENRAKQVFDNYNREREYVSKMSRGSFDNSFTVGTSPKKQSNSPKATSSNVSQFLSKEDPRLILQRMRQNKFAATSGQSGTGIIQMERNDSNQLEREIHHQRQLTWTDLDQFQEMSLPNQKSSNMHSQSQQDSLQSIQKDENQLQAQKNLYLKNQFSSSEEKQQSSQNRQKSQSPQSNIKQQQLASLFQPIKRQTSNERSQNRYAEQQRPSIMSNNVCASPVNNGQVFFKQQQHEDKKDEVIIDIRSSNDPNARAKVHVRSRSTSKSPIVAKPPLARSESANKRVNNLAQQKVSSFIKSEMNNTTIKQNGDIKRDSVILDITNPKFSSRDSSPAVFKNIKPAKKYSPALQDSPRNQKQIQDISKASPIRQIVQPREESKNQNSKSSTSKLQNNQSPLFSARLPKTSIGKTLNSYMNQKLLSKKTSLASLNTMHQQEQNDQNTSIQNFGQNLTTMPYSGAPAGNATINQSLMMSFGEPIQTLMNQIPDRVDNNSFHRQTGSGKFHVNRLSSSGNSPLISYRESNLPSTLTSGARKHQLNTNKKIVATTSRNGLPKQATEQLRKKSVDITKLASTMRQSLFGDTPRTPNLPKPETKPELLLSQSDNNSPENQKTPKKITIFENTPSQRSSIYQIMKKNKSYERLKPINQFQNNIDSSQVIVQGSTSSNNLKSNSHLLSYFNKKHQLKLSQHQVPNQDKKKHTLQMTPQSNNNRVLTYEEYKVIQHHKQKQLEMVHKQTKYNQRQQSGNRRSVDLTSRGVSGLIDSYRKNIINQTLEKKTSQVDNDNVNAPQSRNFPKSQDRAQTQVLNSNHTNAQQSVKKRHNFRPSLTPKRSEDEQVSEIQTPKPVPIRNQQLLEPQVRFTTIRQNVFSSPLEGSEQRTSSSKPHHLMSTDSISNKRQDKFLGGTVDSMNIIEIERSMEREGQLQEAMRRSIILRDSI